MKLCEIYQTKMDAFTYIEIEPDTSGMGMFKDMVDDEAMSDLISKRMGELIKPLTPEIADDIKKKLEDLLGLKLHGKGFINSKKIVFATDRKRLEQKHGNTWDIDEKMTRVVPKGYRAWTLYYFNDPDDTQSTTV